MVTRVRYPDLVSVEKFWMTQITEILFAINVLRVTKFDIVIEKNCLGEQLTQRSEHLWTLLVIHVDPRRRDKKRCFILSVECFQIHFADIAELQVILFIFKSRFLCLIIIVCFTTSLVDNYNFLVPDKWFLLVISLLIWNS